MRIANFGEYLGAQEYECRLSHILADGSSFLRGDDLELFRSSLNHKREQLRRAVEEFEARVLPANLPSEEPAHSLRVILGGGFRSPEQRSASWSWTLPVEDAGIISNFPRLHPDPQLQLFALGSYAAESSVVFGPWQEPIGLSA